MKPLTCFCIAFFFSIALTNHAAEIASRDIASLTKELADANRSRSSVTSKRRAYKNIIRDAETLLRRSEDADNRFEVHALLLSAQKRLLGIENSDENRKDLFDTCEALSKAPDKYAVLRIDADMILMEKRMSGQNADVKLRTDTLKALIGKYRDTPGELKSLTIAYHIAPKLEAFALQQATMETLRERFPADHEAIDFRQRNNSGGRLDTSFAGTFKRANGSDIVFPYDRMGHTSLLIFWSKETSGIDSRLQDVKVLQQLHPGKFDVFSFNLDELPDAGAAYLKTKGLDWTALHLSGGVQHPAFKTYIKRAPEAVLMNAHGHILLETAENKTGHMGMIPVAGAVKSKLSSQAATPMTPLVSYLDSPRYLAQMQSLFIGDFLIQDPMSPRHAATPPEFMTGDKTTLARTPASVPVEALNAIQATFTPPPHRYRLTRPEALANYKKADALCNAAIAQYPNAPDLWLVRNRRIIALQGMWLLSGNAEHLKVATKEASAILALELPDEAKVVAQFCLTQQALRNGESGSYSPVAKFIDAFGGCNAPGTALAAATILALTDNNRELHYEHRETLLEKYRDHSVLWPVTTFLRDRRHRYRIFRATHSRFGFIRAERHSMYRDVAAVDEPVETNRFFHAELKRLDGSVISFPEASGNKHTFVAILEMPQNDDVAKKQADVISYMNSQADQHKAGGVKVLAAFLNGSIDDIKGLAAKHEWTCELAMVPEKIRTAFAAQHGILSADKVPNIFLLRQDGSISWQMSGLTWDVQGQGSLALSPIRYGIEHNIRILQMEDAKAALDAGDFKNAIHLFETSIGAGTIKNDMWGTFRHYGLARAYAGIQNRKMSLTNVNTALDAHVTFGHGKPLHCDLVAEMELFKADVLDQLNQKDNAEQLRRSAAEPTFKHNLSPYGIYSGDRKKHRLNPHQ